MEPTEHIQNIRPLALRDGVAKFNAGEFVDQHRRIQKLPKQMTYEEELEWRAEQFSKAHGLRHETRDHKLWVSFIIDPKAGK